MLVATVLHQSLCCHISVCSTLIIRPFIKLTIHWVHTWAWPIILNYIYSWQTIYVMEDCKYVRCSKHLAAINIHGMHTLLHSHLPLQCLGNFNSNHLLPTSRPGSATDITYVYFVLTIVRNWLKSQDSKAGKGSYIEKALILCIFAKFVTGIYKMVHWNLTELRNRAY